MTQTQSVKTPTIASARVFDGLLLVDKPLGLTSHDVVQKVRRMAHQKGVGHIGTLDPLATGLLALCLGKGSKIARFLTEYDKTYEAQIHLGIRSETFDAEGVDDSQLQSATVPTVSRDELDTVLRQFSGTIEQRAPKYSAIKVDGQPLYRAARRGEKVEAPIRTVTIEDISVSAFEPPYVDLIVSCSKGTYIRSLANDIGESLGCGAYLSGLKRTAIGKLSLADALTLEQIESHLMENDLQQYIITPEAALELPSLIVSDVFSPRVANGLRPDPSDIESVSGSFSAGAFVSLMSTANRLLAVGVSEVDSSEIAGTSKRPIYRHLRVM